jgi:hypothetical protein
MALSACMAPEPQVAHCSFSLPEERARTLLIALQLQVGSYCLLLLLLL